MNSIYFFLLLVLCFFVEDGSSIETIVTCVVTKDEYHKEASPNALSNTVKETCPENTTSFFIQGEVPTFSKNFVSGMDHLLSITMNGVTLEKIEPEALKTLPELTEVILKSNKLQEINPEVFNNPTVGILQLQSNQISALHPGDLTNLPKLEKLNLSKNKIKSVPAGVFNNSKITSLDLSNNEISTIASGAFDDMTHLLDIALHHNKLTTWDGNWFQGSSNLVQVSASHNLIREIRGRAFKNLPKCEILDFESNQIATVSNDAIDGLNNLRRFILKDNKFEELDEGLKSGIKIKEFLDLRGNKISCPKVTNETVAATSIIAFDHC